jgi:hypothetical protein
VADLDLGVGGAVDGVVPVIAEQAHLFTPFRKEEIAEKRRRLVRSSQQEKKRRRGEREFRLVIFEREEGP